MKNINSKTILFITGAFVSNACWDNWKKYFESKGYKTFAPAWPHKNRSAQSLRDSQPNPEIAGIRLADLIKYYSDIAIRLGEKPIVIGHSLGGLLTQILVNRDLASAGVAIHSLAPQGIVPTQFSFYKSTWKSLGFLTNTRNAYLMSFQDWQYAFTNGMTLEQQEESYIGFAIPETKLGLRDGLTNVAKIDFNKPHVPLLFTAGTIDHSIPAALNLINFKKYSDRDSVTNFKLFDGRNHFVLGQPTWQEDADYISNWLNGKA
jgi:pimeloyl-ACP methyl ester carboxylesterase